MNRNLSELTLKELENIIDKHLIKFESYTRIVNPNADHQKFFLHITNLRTILISKKGNLLDCHNELSGILMYITAFYDEGLLIKAKGFVQAAIKMIERKDSTVFSAIHKKIGKIQNIMQSNNEIRNKPIETRTDVEAALRLHERETESMQYPLIQAIRNGLPDEVDLNELFSVIGKVRKGNDYVTDSTAMRDCIAHDKCEIKDEKIIFDNQDYGYEFYLEYTFKEFQDFMGRKGKLYGLLFDSIDLLYMENVLKVYFGKRG